MLGSKDSAATIPVSDLERAKKFYNETLGLAQIDTEGDEAVVYRSGNTRLMVYKSQFAGTSQATVATWAVGQDIEREVKALHDKGVPFEHYDEMPGTRRGNIHDMGSMKAAWFRDPDGNVHALVSR